MSKPKIGIFTRPIDQGTSGSGSHLRQLVSHILKLNKNFNIVLIHYSKNDHEIYEKTTELIIPKNPLLAHFKLKKENFDILHYYPLTILSPVWLKKPKKLTTVHGGGAAELYFPDQFNKLKRIHSKLIKPVYFRKMDYIFSGSNAGKNFVTYQYGVRENRVFFTHSAVDKDFRVYEKKSEKINEKYGIDSHFIFHLSKFSERKNPWTILKAFSIINREKKDLMLVLGGKGWKNSRVLQFAKNEKILDNIIFTGFLPVNDVINLLNNAEMFLFPSFFEGFGMPNLEAMACGCPVITSKAFAIPEIVGDSALILKDNSDPTELADKIIQLLSDEVLRKTLIKKGLERIKLYSWEESALTVLDIYKKCVIK
ncbi:MAG: glycosyltransferase family 4 protein [Candidatus Lokiarchaeota archaeon]|nr:glycosyltransferase family 4 protein [Candidatus Lokiarchaeota archaeon]